MLRLPADVRPLLKRPLGELLGTTAAAAERIRQLHPVRLIAIGDVATAELLKAGVKPDIAVIDFLVMRSFVSDDIKKTIDSYNVRIVRVGNPPGTVTPELHRALETARPPVKIVVRGEENLATLPAVLTAPIGSVIVYGQPNEGMVLIEVTEQKKREFQGLLEKFERAE